MAIGFTYAMGSDAQITLPADQNEENWVSLLSSSNISFETSASSSVLRCDMYGLTYFALQSTFRVLVDGVAVSYQNSILYNYDFVVRTVNVPITAGTHTVAFQGTSFVDDYTTGFGLTVMEII